MAILQSIPVGGTRDALDAPRLIPNHFYFLIAISQECKRSLYV